MSERRKRCEEFLSGHVSKNYANNGGHVQDVPYFIDALEAFAKEQQIKGMEAAAHDLLNRMRQAKESGPCTIQAVRGVTVDHMGWIEDQIAKLKEGW